MTIPSWCRRVLGWIVPLDRREDVLGDLEEVHRRRRAGGPTKAWMRTSAEGLLLIATFLLYRIREGASPGSPLTWAELRLGLRLIRKQPVMAATTVAALATGIGIATLGFTVVDNVLNGSLPFEHGERFVRLEVTSQPDGRAQPLDLELYRRLQRSANFAHFGALDRVELSLFCQDGGAEEVIGAWITPSSFSQLPYLPIAGRTFTLEDGAPGAPPVAILRESLWHRRYAGREEILGQTVEVGGEEFAVVGILGGEAGFPADGEIWLPLDDRYLGGTAEVARRGLTYFGVLRDGVTRSVAQQELAVLSPELLRPRKDDQQTRLRVAPYIESSPQETATTAVMITALLFLIAVIAANIANLVLARTASRRGELAVRTALGAERSRLVGQLGAEVALLGVIAAALALAGCQLGLGWLEPRIPERPFWLDLSVNLRSFAFVVTTTLVAIVVCGVLPGLRATRRDPREMLAAAGGDRGSLDLGRTGALMIVVEMALSVVMLSSSLVIVRGLSEHLQPSYELPEERILTARVIAPAANGEGNAEVTSRLSRRVAEAVNEIPGVRAAGAGSSLPGTGSPLLPVVAEAPASGRSSAEPRLAPVARIKPGFLESLAARPLAGRLIADADLQPGAHPVAVVSEPFARKFFSQTNPIGERIRIVDAAAPEAGHEWRTIVGVVPDLGLNAGGPDRGAGLYLPWAEEPRLFHLALLTRGDPASYAEPLHRAVATVDSGARVAQVMPLAQVGDDARNLMASFTGLLTAVGAMVMALSLAGLYAMVSFAVTARTQEIGIRVALGAGRRQILTVVAGGAGRYLALGSLLGSVVASAAALAGLPAKLFNLPLPPHEPWMLAAATSLLLAAGALACYTPVRRALSIHPADALRFD